MVSSSWLIGCPRRLDARRMGLLVRVVAGTHERPASRMRESHFLCLPRQGVEPFGCNVAAHRQIARAWLKVLPDGQHVYPMFPQLMHDRDDLVVRLAQAQHEA